MSGITIQPFHQLSDKGIVDRHRYYQSTPGPEKPAQMAECSINSGLVFQYIETRDHIVRCCLLDAEDV